MLLTLAAESLFKLMAIFAPPIRTFGRGPHGRPTKYKFGSWMELVLGGHLKRVRCTILDPSRYTEDHKMNLQKLAWLETQLKSLDPANGED